MFSGAKVIAVLVILAIIAGVGWDLKISHEKIGKLETTIVEKDGQIKDLQGELKLAKTSQKLDDKARASVDAKTQVAHDDTKVIADTLDHKVAENKKKFPKARAPEDVKGNYPPIGDSVTPEQMRKLWDEDIEQRQQALQLELANSRVRMVSTWQAYCKAIPDDTDCPNELKPTTEGG